MSAISGRHNGLTIAPKATGETGNRKIMISRAKEQCSALTLKLLYRNYCIDKNQNSRGAVPFAQNCEYLCRKRVPERPEEADFMRALANCIASGSTPSL